MAAASVWKAEGCFSDSRISFPLFYPVGFHKYFMSTFVCQASFLFEAENIQNNPINVWPQKEKKNTERGSIQPRDISKAVYVSGGKDKI